MDKSRQQFEEFIKFHMDDAEENNKFKTANNGLNYSYPYIDLMWITWQSSREPLLLSLPSRRINKGNYDSFTDGYNNGISACEMALLDNGVNDYLLIELGRGDKIFSTIDIKGENKVGLAISPRQDNKRDIGVKFNYKNGTTLADLDPLVLITTDNVKSFEALRDQLSDIIELLNSKTNGLHDE